MPGSKLLSKTPSKSSPQTPGRTPGRAYANLELRLGERQVLVEGRRVGLTVREFQVLLALIEHYDQVVSRADIYDRVWGGELKRRDRAVDVVIRKIRRKLTSEAPGWSYIHTHFGIGYRLTIERLEPGSGPAE